MEQKPQVLMIAEVRAGASETRGLIGSCRRLIEYFGVEEELASWDLAIALANVCLESTLEALTDKIDRRGEWHIPNGPDIPFQCSEPTARIISPLVEVVSGPWPEFVYTIRHSAPPAEQGALLYPYGSFSARFGFAIARPIWRQHPHLAPDNWEDGTAHM